MARRKAVNAEQDAAEAEAPHTHKARKTHGNGNVTMHAEDKPEKQADKGEESAQAPAAPGDGQGAQGTVHRAEEMVDHLAGRLGHYASVLGRQVLRLAARAREEAQDIWAEAQTIRRKE